MASNLLIVPNFFVSFQINQSIIDFQASKGISQPFGENEDVSEPCSDFESSSIGTGIHFRFSHSQTDITYIQISLCLLLKSVK